MTTIRLATILPPGVTQFCDANGDPLANGQIFFYVPNTTTLKNTWQDSQQTILNTNPVILNAAGEAIIYGNGQYTMAVYDQFNNLQWSAITSWTLPDGGDDQGIFLWFGTSGGTPNAQTLSYPDPTLNSLTAGDAIAWLVGPGLTNTGAAVATIAINGGAPITVVKQYETGPGGLSGGEICAGDVVYAIFDGAFLQLIGHLNEADAVPYLGTTGGTANAQTTVGPITGIGQGQVCLIVAGLTNTNAAPLTLMLGTNGPYAVTKTQGGGTSALNPAEWVAGNFYFVTWDGAEIVVLNPSSTTFVAFGANAPVNGKGLHSIFEATAPITLTLNQVATLFNGFDFWVFAKGGAVTLTPNATDSINGGALGANYVVPQGSIVQVRCDGGIGWWVMTTNQTASRFVSTNQAWATSSIVSVAHGLGSTPIQVDAYLVCTTNDHSWVVGEKIRLVSDAVSVFGGPTNVGAVFDPTGPNLVNKGTFADFIPAPTNWALILEANL